MNKLCIKCNLNKSSQEFYKGLNYCKVCKSVYAKEYSLKNEEKLKEASRKYYVENKEKIKLYNIKNREKKAEKEKAYRLINKAKIASRRKEISATEKGKEAKRRSARIYSKKRRGNDIKFRLTINIRNRTKNALKWGSKGGSAVKDLGLSMSDYKVYLESMFQEGMTWKNYGHGSEKWTIDHIKPLSKFNLSNREEFLLACHYTNTQPMWYNDNVKKSNMCKF